jgi:hypothetical protein
MTLRQPTDRHGGNAKNDEEAIMSDHINDLRRASVESIRKWVSREEILTDLSIASAGFESRHEYLYVERKGQRYRWSPAHRGGAYPLLRIAARYLDVSHHQIILGFRTVGDYAIICEKPNEFEQPDAWCIIDTEVPCTPEEIENLLTHNLPDRSPRQD